VWFDAQPRQVPDSGPPSGSRERADMDRLGGDDVRPPRPGSPSGSVPTRHSRKKGLLSRWRYWTGLRALSPVIWMQAGKTRKLHARVIVPRPKYPCRRRGLGAITASTTAAHDKNAVPSARTGTWPRTWGTALRSPGLPTRRGCTRRRSPRTHTAMTGPNSRPTALFRSADQKRPIRYQPR